MNETNLLPHGLIVALTTPFNNHGIDIKSLQQHIGMLSPYINGLIIGGTTGESQNLTDDELVILLQESKTLIAGKLLITGFWRSTIQIAITTAKHVEKYADILLVPIPSDLFHQSDVSIIEFYSKLTKVCSKPILMYNFPARCAQYAINAQLATIIAKSNPNIIGIKDSSADVQLTRDIIINSLPLQPILGNDRFLVEISELTKTHNCNYQMTSISGASSVPLIAKIEAEIYSLLSNGNYLQAKTLQQELNNKYFEPWSKQSARLGGEAPIIKTLIKENLPDYPIIVRSPLKEFKKKHTNIS
jgi:dihydrodipicolinate synthase/N-acetylneuraminate lyase